MEKIWKPKGHFTWNSKTTKSYSKHQKGDSHPFGMGKANHEEQGCLHAKTCEWKQQGKMSFSCQSAQVHEFITKNLFSWTQAFSTHILAQYLQPYSDISWIHDFANITQVFCELSNNFLVCLEHCIVPGGTMMPMGWGMFIISCSWVVPPAISKIVSDSPLITQAMVSHRKRNKNKI